MGADREPSPATTPKRAARRKQTSKTKSNQGQGASEKEAERLQAKEAERLQAKEAKRRQKALEKCNNLLNDKELQALPGVPTLSSLMKNADDSQLDAVHEAFIAVFDAVNVEVASMSPVKLQRWTAFQLDYYKWFTKSYTPPKPSK